MPRTRKKRNIRRKKKSNNYLFKMLCICFLIGIGVFYLLQVNEKSTSAYKMNDLKKEISNLKEAKESLELKASELQSLASVNDRLEDLKMVAVEKMEYLKTKEAVAVAK